MAVLAGLWFSGDRLAGSIAAMLPRSVLAPIGRSVVTELGGDKGCDATDGKAALDSLLRRLRPAQGFIEPITLTVADRPVVNAFAAPGGQIVIFRGLIDKAQSADELAGVLAHEVTHVQHRHPGKMLIRQAGLSLLIKAIAGDVGQAADTAVLLRGSRNAERAADAGALDLLRQAHISPAGFADFFKRMEPGVGVEAR